MCAILSLSTIGIRVWKFTKQHSENVDLALPNTSGTLATQEWVGSYVAQKLAYKLLYNGFITPTATDTQYTPTETISTNTMAEIKVDLVYRPTSRRQSFDVPVAALTAGYVFPDFSFAGTRAYFSLTVNSSGKLVVGGAGNTGSTGWGTTNGTLCVAIYYR